MARTQTQNRLEKKSISDRIELVNQSRDVIKNKGLFGVGVGNYTLFSYQNDFKKRPIWQHQPVHNIYLLIWSELGIFGVLVFGFLIFKVIIESIKFLKVDKNELRLNLLIGFFGLLFISLLDHWIYSFYFGTMTFWLLIGLVDKIDLNG